MNTTATRAASAAAAHTSRTVADGARFAQNAKSRVDATRFAQNVRSPPLNGGGGETPQQRVARLREAARRERMNQVTTFDRIVHRGRIWADNLHRATVFTIMGFSVVIGGITIYSVYGMMSVGRANRTEYLKELAKERELQQAMWRHSEVAQMSQSLNISPETAAQLFDEAEETRRKSLTAWGRLKTWAYGGLTPAEETYMSRYELHEDRIHKQVYARLQKDFYDKRGMKLPKKDEDEEEEEELGKAMVVEGASTAGVVAGAATPAATDGTVSTASVNDVKENVKDAVEKAKSESKGYWGTIRSLVTSGRM